MTTVTADLRDVASIPDNARWVFTTVLRESGDGDSIVTSRRVPVQPVLGVLTADLDPGYCEVLFGGRKYVIDVPESGTVDLWDLLAAAIGAPPGTPAAAIAAAVEAYLAANPPEGGGGGGGGDVAGDTHAATGKTTPIDGDELPLVDSAASFGLKKLTFANLKAWVKSWIAKADVGLGNVDNTTDAAKPVSSDTQTALDLKAPLASPTFTGTVAGVTKAHVGLGSVDNTADTAKPVSTAQQTALDGKQTQDSDLTAIAGLSPSNDDVVQRKAGAWTNRTPTQLKTDLAVQTDDIADLDVTGASSGDSLVFDGSDWVATEALPVNITTPADGDLFSYDSGNWVNVSAPDFGNLATHIVKPSDTGKMSDTTLAKDGDFDLAVVSGEQWFIEYFLLIGSGSQTPDLKVALVAPSSSTGWWAIDGLVESATSGAASMRRTAATSFGTGTFINTATNTSGLFAKVVAVVTAGATGTIEFWWAQMTSDATASTIKAGSLLRAIKVN